MSARRVIIGPCVDSITLVPTVVLAADGVEVMQLTTESALKVGAALIQSVGVAQAIAGMCQEIQRCAGSVDVARMVADLQPALAVDGWSAT